MAFQRTQVEHGWPDANLARNRICHFENLCWVRDQFVFYEDPTLNATPNFLRIESLMESEGGPLLHLGYTENTGWSPKVIHGPLPPEAPINSSAIFLLSENSYSDNFAHLLIDDLIPALQGLSVFNFNRNDGLLLSLSGCAKTSRFYQPDSITPYANRTRRDVCLDNYSVYTPLVLGRPFIDIKTEWIGKTVCLRHVLAGHSSLVSLRTLDVQRASSLRSARDRIVNELGLAALPPPSSQRVLVLTKRTGFNGGPIWPTLCQDTERMFATIDPKIPIHCMDPVEKSVQDQARHCRDSTIIVAEQGTTGYTAMYGHDGTVLLLLASRKVVKDLQISLYTNHVQTYFLAEEDKDTLFDGATS